MIRKISWFIGMAMVIAFSNTSNAQLCTPNPIYTNPGVYPDTATALATGCVGSFYHQDFTVVVPQDTTLFGFTFPISYITIDSITGMPPGFFYACNPASCTFPGGSSNCFQVYGNPTVSGAFHLTIYIHGVAIVFGTPTTINYQYPGYDINIGVRPVLTTGSLPSTCTASNGTAWVNATGSSGYSYIWNTTPVSNNDTIYNQSAGMYQVTVNSLYNCATIDTVLIADVGAPTVDTIIVSDVLCNGDATGSATVVPQGGTAPFDYLWSTGDTTSTLVNAGAGNYTVSIYDANGCLLSSGATINQPTLLQVFTSQNDVTCNGVNNGSALATVVGGVGTYDYNWSSGSTSASATSLNAGNYTIIVTDDNNCTATDSVMISEPPVITTNINASGVTCFGGSDGSATINITGGSPGYSVLWSNGDTTLNTGGLVAGTYFVSVTDSLGCITSDTVAISQPTAIMISLVGTDESILGASDGAVDATISGGTPGYFYLWNNGSTLQDISGIPGGVYILTVTDLNGCSNSDTITVNTLPGFGVETINSGFEIYPNPATDILFISSQMEGTLVIHDMFGKEILGRNLNKGLQSMQLSNLSKGIYIVNIFTDGQRKTHRLVIQ